MLYLKSTTNGFNALPARCPVSTSTAQPLGAHSTDVVRPSQGGRQKISSARDRSDDQQWFLPRRNRIRKRIVGRVMRQVFLAREETQEGSALLRVRGREWFPAAWGSGPRGHRPRSVASPDPTHRVRLRCRHAPGCASGRAMPPGSAHRSALVGHCSVCTSTDSTPGRSRTMAFQSRRRRASINLSAGGAEVDAALVQRSTAIASRSTFT